MFSLSSQSSDDPSGPDQSLSQPSSLYQLSEVYKNPLSRTSCNMTIGAFGRADGERVYNGGAQITCDIGGVLGLCIYSGTSEQGTLWG